MLQINNNTPFIAELHPFSDVHGRDYAVALVKGSFLVDPKSNTLVVSEQQVEVKYADEFYAEPGKSSIKYPSDISLVKGATDVLLIGHAYAPNEQAVRALEITLSIDSFTKTVRILGDRVWQKSHSSWQATLPREFTQIPLCYENAFGGTFTVDSDPDSEEVYDQNPFGKGFITEDNKHFEGMALPNIEDPRCLLNDPYKKLKPAGFGAIGRDWQPRLALAGTYDKEWQEQRMPLLPLDFNPQFFSCAHPDLRIQPLLKGGEFVSISNVCKTTDRFAFNIPTDKIIITASIRKQESTYVAQMDTLLIEPDENRVVVTWRVAIPCTRKFLYIDSITIKRVA